MSSRREFLVEYRAHSPTSSVFRHRSSTSRSSLCSAGATRRSPRPATPRALNQKVVSPCAEPAPEVAGISAPSSAQTLVGVHGQTQTKRLSTESVRSKATLATSPRPPVGAGRKFGRFRGRGTGNPKPLAQQRKSIFFHVVHFFAKG